MHSLEISKGADTALQVANVLVFILKTLRLIQVLYCEEKKKPVTLSNKGLTILAPSCFGRIFSVFIKKMIISGFLNTSLTRTSFQIVDRCLTRKKKTATVK